MNVTKSLVRVFAGKAFIYSYRGIAVNPDFNSKSETTNNLPSHFLNIIKINVDQSESAALIFLFAALLTWRKNMQLIVALFTARPQSVEYFDKEAG